MLRVIQEACNNAVKHAQASYLEVKVSYLEKKIVLVIKDDGKGFDVCLLYTSTTHLPF